MLILEGHHQRFSMPFPRWLARVNLHVTNHILGPLARYMPGMGVIVHIGRRTHHRYRTPVLVFRRGDHFIVALTYGRGAQWVQNVLAEGACELETRGRMLRLTQPRIVHDAQRRLMPAVVAGIPGIINVSDFLEISTTG